MSFLFGIKTYKQTRKDNQTENFQLANEYLLTHRINYFLKADIFFYFRKCKVKANVHFGVMLTKEEKSFLTKNDGLIDVLV
ncbi:unnamed protein product [Rhizophagus irregularis]|uniref:Uncharacterized protein n=1 Tax=Rhizophagus irregularis TaxID=588596 RepID=A0A915Z883_9GLOM|nr:unnamed protein product [Rhizophagus irregularis]